MKAELFIRESVVLGRKTILFEPLHECTLHTDGLGAVRVPTGPLPVPFNNVFTLEDPFTMPTYFANPYFVVTAFSYK